jgi:hypothetical protein
LLPNELKNENQLQIYRAVNDELTKEEIGSLASQKANCTDF